MSVTIAHRDLRNDVASILRRVAQGESFTVTVRGEALAQLVPVQTPSRFVPRARIVEILQQTPLDAGLLEELRAMDVAEDEDDRGQDDLAWEGCSAPAS